MRDRIVHYYSEDVQPYSKHAHYTCYTDTRLNKPHVLIGQTVHRLLIDDAVHEPRANAEIRLASMNTPESPTDRFCQR